MVKAINTSCNEESLYSNELRFWKAWEWKIGLWTRGFSDGRVILGNKFKSIL
jgi:hypothetical protein